MSLSEMHSASSSHTQTLQVGSELSFKVLEIIDMQHIIESSCNKTQMYYLKGM